MSPRPEFAFHKLNPDGIARAMEIADLFSVLLDQLETPYLADRDGREMAVVRTKLEEACFFAKKAMATRPRNQEPHA